jgi:hypothetical protein
VVAQKFLRDQPISLPRDLRMRTLDFYPVS